MHNKDRNPWLAGLFTFFTIGLGHIYTGQAKKGILLFFIGQGALLAGALPLIYYFPTVTIFISTLLIGFAFFIYCILDAVKVSKRYRFEYTLKKYNKWYIYVGCWILAAFIIQPIVSSSIKLFIIQAYKIPSGAMKPTLQVGDHIIADKFTYRNSEPKRGDIAIFPFPEDPSKDFIKRIVGMGGDTLEIRNKQVFINGEPYQERYKVDNDSYIFPKNVQPRDNYGPIKIPEDSLFVMGDNRDASYDSRFWGLVKKSSVKGKAKSIYWSWDKDRSRVRWNRIGRNIR